MKASKILSAICDNGMIVSYSTNQKTEQIIEELRQMQSIEDIENLFDTRVMISSSMEAFKELVAGMPHITEVYYYKHIWYVSFCKNGLKKFIPLF